MVKKTFIILLVTAVALMIFVAVSYRGGEPIQVPADSLSGELSAATRSGSNAHPAVFVGSASCIQCHQAQSESWNSTAHSKAMSIVDPATEPSDGDFHHKASGRYYHIRHRDGELWHAESLSPSWNPDVETENGSAVLASAPLKYLVGSGRHSRSYLVEEDGFLMESPITWYTSTQSWKMSPGYDQPNHPGFERPANTGCITCHAGQIRAVDNSFHKIEIGEAAIGCERCHGPGSRHVEKWSELGIPEKTSGEADSSIVNPQRLSRELQDALCAQCHLRGDATVLRSGFEASDFRPGSRLEDVRIDFFARSDAGDMKVVGHVDQMKASLCYQKSDVLNCVTCHAGHPTHGDRRTPESWRQTCLTCHDVHSCTEPVEDRGRISPNDSCIQCHMPQVETDIPHIAFTHHRIGIHLGDAGIKNNSTSSIDPVKQLVPFGDVSALSPEELRRCEALACAEYALKAETRESAEEFRSQAVSKLSLIAKRPNADAEVLATLARLHWDAGNQRSAVQLAERSMIATDTTADSRVNSLFIIGDICLQNGEFAKAEIALTELTRLRRNSEDWLLLGLAQFQNGEQNQGLSNVEKALSIQPFRDDIRQALTKMYQAAGRVEE